MLTDGSTIAMYEPKQYKLASRSHQARVSRAAREQKIKNKISGELISAHRRVTSFGWSANSATASLEILASFRSKTWADHGRLKIPSSRITIMTPT